MLTFSTACNGNEHRPHLRKTRNLKTMPLYFILLHQPFYHNLITREYCTYSSVLNNRPATFFTKSARISLLSPDSQINFFYGLLFSPVTLFSTRDLSTRRCSGNHFVLFHIKCDASNNNSIIRLLSDAQFLLQCPLRFEFLLQGKCINKKTRHRDLVFK